MNPLFRKVLYLLLISSAALMAQSCGGGNKMDGELTGVLGREGWKQEVPYGMIVVPAGTFHMGQADEDILSSRINMNRQITIGGFYMDQTEITNNEYRQFIEEMTNNPDSIDGEMLTEEEIKARFYPDTMVWENDFTHHYGEPMVENYYSHPAYDDYPIVGVNWFAAKAFCGWRTKFLNEAREGRGEFPQPKFRLPSEAEWEYASRGGRDMAKYPWGGPYVRNAKGCALANFKPGRGNYYDDGFQYTNPVGAYFPNDWGLYDMAGNVAEWCNDAYAPNSMPLIWDLNPTYIDDSEPRKVVRGGSWKDIAFFIETGSRTFEYQDSARSFVGFRCVMTYLGRSSGMEF
ncbi:SUMF1/EgtB/PvdO family nonheme iron enzyme [Hugenholtzia roseola]|uniref:type IX secretion system lipoprotein PorK/GldK n=1 Tax=Hugenholtzia roseola TaxID=1002 RepID=UPI00047E8157|nr:SUMF1/EgtB/PvdO family nonheme iron enzyme [Hugenholtzia roseola]